MTDVDKIDQSEINDFITYITDNNLSVVNTNNDIITLSDGDKYKVPKEFNLNQKSNIDSDLIFGKNTLTEVVALEVNDGNVLCYKNCGNIVTYKHTYWVLTPNYKPGAKKLSGNLHYKYINEFNDKRRYSSFISKLKKTNSDYYTIWNEKESAMIYHGITLFKDLKIEDVSVLSFDIEASGLVQDDTSEVFVITNTIKVNGKTEKKQFRVDYYNNQQEMIEDWCEWVVSKDPTILTGHNINGYDLPYIEHCYGVQLPLGKFGEKIKFNKKPSEKRVDGTQSWSYKKIECHGRHIIDGMFLAVMYDIGRNYPSWGLKAIAEYEGFVAEDRQFYDASKIGQNWKDLVEREKIVKYCEHDSDDSLSIYELMAPSCFYMCQSVPKPFQLITESASGSWLNAIMIRAYLQQGHSIPKKSENKKVAGGMSWGNPGIYNNVSKWDAASYYPNTILTFNIYDKEKDPNGYFLKMVKYFTDKRFEQKRQYKETKDKYYNDLQASSKVFINSSYGLLGTSGLNFNSFENAALITKCCRKGLQKAIKWATGKDANDWWAEYSEEQDFNDYSFIDTKSKWSYEEMPQHNWHLVNIDTDSLSFAKPDGSEWTQEEQEMIYNEINKIMYSDWEDDGEFDKVLVLKAKNYCLVPKGENKLKKKGSSITDSKKEPALTELLDECIRDLLDTKGQNIETIYNKYIKEVTNIKDISRWSVKKTITKAVLNPTRTNESKILDALHGKKVQEGDKVFLFSDIDGEVQAEAKGELIFYKNGEPKMIPNRILRLTEESMGSYDLEHYLERVYKTMDILKNVIDMDRITKYHLKKNQKLLEEL